MLIENVDLKLHLLAGDPLIVNGLGMVNPLTLRHIKDVGFTSYSECLNLLLFDIRKIEEFKSIPEEELEKITIFDLAVNIGQDSDLFDRFMISLQTFLPDSQLTFSKADFHFKVNDGKLDKENYKQFLEVLRLQNCIEPTAKEEYKAVSDKAKDILSKIKRYKEEVKEVKKIENRENEIDIGDIISAVSTKSLHYDKKTIWELTMYQLYDEYNRLRVIDDYYTNIKALMAGAEKIELKHWSKRIVNEE